jgi:hypothetical protein
MMLIFSTKYSSTTTTLYVKFKFVLFSIWKVTKNMLVKFVAQGNGIKNQTFLGMIGPKSIILFFSN